MVIILHQHIHEDDKSRLRNYLQDHGYRVKEIIGEEETIFGAVGPAVLDIRDVEVQPGVQRVIPISKPYKLASRELKQQDTVVSVGSVRIGGGRIALIAGPCSVESREQIMETARTVRDAGAVMLRGGAYKPRTSPYSFQGLGAEGLKYLREAGDAYGLPVVSEIVSPQHVDDMLDFVDMFQIGARNMQNFELLKAVGQTGTPVLLKRGLSARIEEWLMAAEYLMAHGTDNVVLCERGIRTFETYTRNSLDLSSIPVVKKLSHLPVIVDPSHATGIRENVMPMAMAGVSAGADGLMVEVHPDPDHAKSDGAQSLYPQQFEKLARDIEALCPVLHRELERIPLRSYEILTGTSPGSGSVNRGALNRGTPVADQGSAAQGGSAQLGVNQPGAGAGGLEDGTRASRADKPGPADENLSAVPIAFQGEAGAYSEMALYRYFSPDIPSIRSIPCPDFKTAFTRVLAGEAAYAILPIENSLTGSIHENYDLLLQFPDIVISGEIKIRIQHSLMGLPGTRPEDLQAVYSHPQGLAQCSRYLDGLKDCERRPFYDTAGAVAYVAREQNPRYGAIANAAAAGVYGLEVLKEGIETNPNNYTRFVVIQREDQAGSAPAQKASLVFSTPDRPGALLSCMERLSSRKLNLSKLESRPIHGKPWEYMFYLDVDIDGREEDFQKALEDISEYSDDIRVLGVYGRG